jgi:hypothetical protein
VYYDTDYQTLLVLIASINLASKNQIQKMDSEIIDEIDLVKPGFQTNGISNQCNMESKSNSSRTLNPFDQ